MKKAILLTLFCITSMIAFSQSEGTHLKFMGIELDGTINEFQEKLLKKGVTIDPGSKLLPNGIRSFKGKFSGEEADIAVFYNPQDKTVYRAKAMITRYGKDSIERLMSTFENKLDLKYGTDNKHTSSERDDKYNKFNQHVYSVENGRISLFIIAGDGLNYGEYYLHVDYHDWVNNLMNTMDEMDDL